MIIFNGYKLAGQKEEELKRRVRSASRRIKIAAILFTEDAGSRLYTGLKREAAQRVGIEYEVHEFSLKDEASEVIKLIKLLNQDKSITGIIIQKPTGACWRKFQIPIPPRRDKSQNFQNWWQGFTSQIKLEKDVDGLHPQTLESIRQANWQRDGRVLPATVRAVLEILNNSHIILNNKKILILNRSDILGRPLYYELKNQGLDVKIWGSKDLETERAKIRGFDLIISGTGRANLITGDMVKDGVMLIDVGEPKGDIDFESVKKKASFITPVPGGVGPMTVVSLLENAVDLVKKNL